MKGRSPSAPTEVVTSARAYAIVSTDLILRPLPARIGLMQIGAADLSYLLSVWGTVGAPVGDLNGDGVIGAADLATLLAEWGPLEP